MTKKLLLLSVLFLLLSLNMSAQNESEGIQKTSSVQTGDLLSRLLKPHEGKVILIDFWNTWCPPCRQAMNDFSEAKESYKDKDVVFIYLTNELSPEEIWENLTANIDGEHHRFSNEEIDYLKGRLGVSGIPSYAIINKKGEQVYARNGFEGAKKLSEVIDRCLAE